MTDQAHARIIGHPTREGERHTEAVVVGQLGMNGLPRFGDGHLATGDGLTRPGARQDPPNLALTRSSTACGMRVSKSWIFAHVGATSIRVIRSYRACTPSSHCGNSSAGVTFLAPATYSGKTPSTSETAAVPRISSTFGGQTGALVSMVKATTGFAWSAATFAEPGIVPITSVTPFQLKPTGTTRGVPSTAM